VWWGQVQRLFEALLPQSRRRRPRPVPAVPEPPAPAEDDDGAEFEQLRFSVGPRQERDRYVEGRVQKAVAGLLLATDPARSAALPSADDITFKLPAFP
jgi:hypothetical protein